MFRTQECDDLDREIESLVQDGYRLDRIMPADAPRVVQLSKNEEIVRLVLSTGFSRPQTGTRPPEGRTQNIAQTDWVMGRAGMLYRELTTDRLGGQIVASHIRLTEGGEVPDYVHYHKIEFQMIRCIKGRIRVVYEDQGPPFWLEPGDWVVQPPEIRHRVLECEAGSEVIEISIPAEHETWVDHEMTLPTDQYRPERDFGGQRFVRHVAAESS